MEQLPNLFSSYTKEHFAEILYELGKGFGCSTGDSHYCIYFDTIKDECDIILDDIKIKLISYKGEQKDDLINKDFDRLPGIKKQQIIQTTRIRYMQKQYPMLKYVIVKENIKLYETTTINDILDELKKIDFDGDRYTDEDKNEIRLLIMINFMFFFKRGRHPPHEQIINSRESFDLFMREIFNTCCFIGNSYVKNGMIYLRAETIKSKEIISIKQDIESEDEVEELITEEFISEELSTISIKPKKSKSTPKGCKTEGCPIKYTQKKYDNYCLRCYVNLFPEKSNSKNYKTKEFHVYEYLKSKLPNVTLINDKKIQDGCSNRRPDILLDMGFQVIIIEIDENKHNNHENLCDNKRIMQLSQDINHRPLVLIRFNPDCYTKGDEKIISPWSMNKLGIYVIKREKEWIERLVTLEFTVKYWMNIETNKTVEIVHLFYDC